MKIACWNVNSVRKREAQIVDWLNKSKVDVLLLQELKCEESQFPAAIFLAAGYEALVVGEKSYNGVAVLSASALGKPRVRARHLPQAEHLGARYLEVEFENLVVASLYLPNGNPVGTEKFEAKRAWMDALEAHADSLLKEERAIALGGDYNIIPTARDCHDPTAWEGDALFRPESRGCFRRLCNSGWVDPLDPNTTPPRGDADAGLAPWTFWGYQAGAWQADEGIRIDHILLSPLAADRFVGAGIDREPRGGTSASDHTPVWCELKEAAPSPPNSSPNSPVPSP